MGSPITPQVMTKSEGFMSGAATRNATSGTAGKPEASSPPTTGIEAKVQAGEATPARAASAAALEPFRSRARWTRRWVTSRATSTPAAGPRSTQYHIRASSDQNTARIS